MAEPCTDCDGRGYVLVYPDGEGSPEVDIQRCDVCREFRTDDRAALAFVEGLRNGDEYAYTRARSIVATLEPTVASRAGYR